jgi:UDPglucose--hexose-1-phosphate uridylyltransferase
MRELRKDPVSGRWVIISTDRAERPQHRSAYINSAALGPCPFCAGNEAMTPPEVLAYRSQSPADMPGWTVRVVPNKYPALADEGGPNTNKSGIYECMNSVGVHEVIIESAEHVTNLWVLTEKQLEEILRAYRDRITALRKDARWSHVLIYKNQGAEAGATLPHAHSQLVALPTVPEEIRKETRGAKSYYDRAGHCIYCEMIQQEINDKSRLVAQNDRFVTFCPYAPRFPYESWILPRQHASHFEGSSTDDFAELARSLREILLRLHRQLDNPPFNYLIHSNPLAEMENKYYHWHLEILPRLTQVAGFEWGSGVTINPVAPEEAARLLREVDL